MGTELRLRNNINHIASAMKNHFPVDLIFVGFFIGTVLVDVTGENSYDVKRVVVLSLTIIIACIAFFDKRYKCIQPSLYSVLALFSFFVIGIFSSFKGAHPFFSAVDMVNYVSLICFFILLLPYFSRMSLSVIIHRSFLWVCLYTVLYFYEFILGIYFSVLVGLPLERLVGAIDYSHPRFFNQLQVVLVPTIFAAWFLFKEAKLRMMARFCLVAHIVVLIITHARGAILCLLLAAVIVLPLLVRQKRRLFIKEILIVVVLGVFISQLLVFSNAQLSAGRGISPPNVAIKLTNSSGRIGYWRGMLDEIAEEPLLGHAPFSVTWQQVPHFRAHPHNFSIQILFEYGVLAFLMIVIIALRFFVKAFTVIKDEDNIDEQTALIFVFMAILSATGLSQFSGMFVMPFAQLLFIFVLVIFVSRYIKLYSIVDMKKRFLCMLAILSSCFILLFSQAESSIDPGFSPRIWLDGAL